MRDDKGMGKYQMWILKNNYTNQNFHYRDKLKYCPQWPDRVFRLTIMADGSKIDDLKGSHAAWMVSWRLRSKAQINIGPPALCTTLEGAAPLPDFEWIQLSARAGGLSVLPVCVCFTAPLRVTLTHRPAALYSSMKQTKSGRADRETANVTWLLRFDEALTLPVGAPHPQDETQRLYT